VNPAGTNVTPGAACIRNSLLKLRRHDGEFLAPVRHWIHKVVIPIEERGRRDSEQAHHLVTPKGSLYPLRIGSDHLTGIRQVTFENFALTFLSTASISS
jgi:hypothetical protein